MKKNTWLERGLQEIDNNHFFDGFQMIQGALQRAFRFDEPEEAKMVIIKSLSRFQAKGQIEMACDIMGLFITNLKKKVGQRIWIELIPYFFVELKNLSLISCIKTLNNQIIADKSFQDSNFLLHMNNLILEDKFKFEIVSDLYFIQAGLLCKKKEYVSCFEVLDAWSKEIPTLSSKMIAYLTLAEINAYEIEDCGSYLKHEDQYSDNEKDDTDYLEISSRIFQAVKNSSINDFYSTISDYVDIIDWKKDALLKALCDAISEIFQSKSGSGIFSSLLGS